MLVHGVTGTGPLEWRGMVGELADDYRCIVPDLRGHGRSELGTAPLRVSTLAGDLLALCETLALDRPHLVGFSIGGHTVLQAALAHPDLAASLTFIGYSSGRPPEHRGDPDQTARPPEDWPVLLRQAHAHNGPDHWEMLYRELSRDWAGVGEIATADLARLAGPVLVVQGVGEVAFKHRQAYELQAAVAGTRVEIVSGGDHPIHLQQPHLVQRFVHEHIDAAEATLDR